MPRFAVKQPNGKYAVFSTIVDNFVAANQTREEAFEYWRDEAGVHVAETKITSADIDAECGADDIPLARTGDGLGRWRACLKTIASAHGMEELRDMLLEFELSQSQREQWEEETELDMEAKGETP